MITWPRAAASTGVIAAIALIVAVPYALHTYTVSLLAMVCVVALLAASVNFMAGQMKLLSIGHAGIAASAGYAIGWSTAHGFGLGAQLGIALAVTLVVSAVYGLTSMRTSGIFFLMVTLALGMVIFGLAYRLSTITGGENGITGIRRPGPFAQTWQFYYFSAAVLIVALAAIWVVQRSPFGLVLNGIRDSESRMSSLGYWVPAYKFAAMMISGTLAGVAGVMAVWHSEFVSPSSAGFMRSALAVLIVILGGVGMLIGPVVGAAIVVWAEFVLSTSFERWPTALGIVFIVVVLFAPRGIVGELAGVNWSRLLRRRTVAAPVAATAAATSLAPGSPDTDDPASSGERAGPTGRARHSHDETPSPPTTGNPSHPATKGQET